MLFCTASYMRDVLNDSICIEQHPAVAREHVDIWLKFCYYCV